MRLLKTIGEKDNSRTYQTRKAARATVSDNEGKIALLHVSKQHYYKLPGGGIENGENKEEGLRRECLEEIGCEIEITGEVGSIQEYRHFPDGLNEDQESFCYTANVRGEKKFPHFEQEEINDGFEALWVAKEEAMELLKKSEPNSYDGKFIVVRELEFIEESLKN